MFNEAHLVGELDSSRPVALITGGASNIGHAIATRLEDDGYHILTTTYPGHSTQPKSGDPVYVTIDEARELGARMQWDVVVCDLASGTDCSALIDLIQSRYGRLDCLVNNAATWTYGRIEEIGDDQWRHVLEVNVLAPVRLVREGRELLRASAAPRVVNIGSSAGFFPEAGVGPYCVSKAAVHALTQWLAIELARDSVLVNAVAPGFIETSTNSLCRDDDKVLALRLKTIPLGRPGTVDAVAHVVSFLASPNLDFVTGEIFRCDGGFLAGASDRLLTS